MTLGNYEFFVTEQWKGFGVNDLMCGCKLLRLGFFNVRRNVGGCVMTCLTRRRY